MKFLLSIFIFFSYYSTLYADEIFNLLKIPNLEVLELNSKNKIKYFNTKENFIIGTTQNIVCDKVEKNNLIKKYKVVKRNLDIYSYEFLKKNNLSYYQTLYTSKYNKHSMPRKVTGKYSH